MSNTVYETVYEKFIGQTVTEVTIDNKENRIVFKLDTGIKWLMYHSQDCCENVYIESIVGDMDDLINNPILQATEVSRHDTDTGDAESETWTFYRFSTNKGTVVIRWYGSSNGYYSEGVSFNEN